MIKWRSDEIRRTTFTKIKKSFNKCEKILVSKKVQKSVKGCKKNASFEWDRWKTSDGNSWSDLPLLKKKNKAVKR